MLNNRISFIFVCSLAERTCGNCRSYYLYIFLKAKKPFWYKAPTIYCLLTLSGKAHSKWFSNGTDAFLTAFQWWQLEEYSWKVLGRFMERPRETPALEFLEQLPSNNPQPADCSQRVWSKPLILTTRVDGISIVYPFIKILEILKTFFFLSFHL